MRVQEGDYTAVEFSLQSIEQVPHNFLNPLTQTRKIYQYEGLEELKAAILARDENNEPRYELFHPLMVNRVNDQGAAEYLADLNLCHGTEHTVEQLTRAEDGYFYIIIAGHRRHIATGSIIIDDGLDPSTPVACSVYENLSFREALRKQIDENTHQQLSVTETARAIQASYRFGLAKGDYTSVADCIRDLPFGEYKIRNALKFCELPEEVQSLVEEEYINYGVAVALYPMIHTLHTIHANLCEEDRGEIVRNRLLEYAFRAMNNDWTKAIALKVVGEFINLHSVQQSLELSLNQESEVELARKARHIESKRLFSGGVNNLRAFFAVPGVYEDLPEEHKEAMAEELTGMIEKLGYTATVDVKPVHAEESLFQRF